MIRTAELKDYKKIYNLKKMNMNTKADSKDLYFQHIFDISRTLVNEVNGQIKSSLQMDYFPLIINSKKIMTSFFDGLFYDDNDVNYFDEVFKELLNQSEHTSLLSGIFYNYNEKFKLNGFKKVYRNKIYTIKRHQLNDISYANVSKEFTIEELVSLYNEFTSHFTGYLYRNQEYWITLLRYYVFLNYYVVVYKDEKKQPKGYIVYSVEGENVIIHELVYLTGVSLLRMLSYALQSKHQIKVKVSECENLEFAIKEAEYELVDECELKINDFNLFNELFCCNIKDETELKHISNKPLWISRGY